MSQLGQAYYNTLESQRVATLQMLSMEQLNWEIENGAQRMLAIQIELDILQESTTKSEQMLDAIDRRRRNSAMKNRALRLGDDGPTVL